VSVWADGIHLQARLEDEKQRILVLIGATPEGRKELIGVTDGARESVQDWRELLLHLKRRGLDVRPELAIADGALGFWKAAGEVWPAMREQRCWVHKTANVLGKLPKSQQPKAKRALQEIWMAETKADAEAAFDAFIESYQVKYEKAAECLTKDRDALLTFYDFPAEHWKHLQTTNPIERTFATVRHRSHDPVERMPVEPHRARHGLQARRSRTEKLATPRRQQPIAKTGSRCEIRRWARGCRQTCQPSTHKRRRLTDQVVTKNRR
jgi:transposase-like protein